MSDRISKRELHKAVNAEMVTAANKVVELKAKQKETERQIEYWTRQEEAARTVSIRLDIESDEGVTHEH